MVDELAILRAELRELSARVASLEDAGAKSGAAASDHGSGPSGGAEADWVLAGLDRERARHPELAQGALLLAGSGTLPSGQSAAWQQTVGLRETLDSNWGVRAASLVALAHPVRIELVRHILLGVSATADLAEIESLGTTGQLHHHLRQLVAAGWVAQSGRGNYEIPADRVTRLLALVIAA